MPPVTVAAQAIAQAALAEMFRAQYDDGAHSLYAEFLIGQASRVRFQPSTQQLVLTFDLAFNSSEAEQSGPVT